MPLQATSGAASYDAFGGGVAAVPNYIEDVFSTYLYTGNNAQRSISNGIDLSTKGGLVWLKSRSSASYPSHTLWDTTRGISKYIQSNTTNAQASAISGATYYGVNAFNTDGFSLGLNWLGENETNVTYASWTFRKQPKFFDVVTYTGTGSNRTIAHNLGSTPGCIIVKRTDNTSNWQVYHNGLTSAAYSAQLNLSSGQTSSPTVWNSTAPTSTVFSVGTDTTVNANGGTYVAYIYASNAGGFGLTGTDNVITCGSFTSPATNSSVSVNLGYEPQWILFKDVNNTADDWYVADSMRGLNVTSVTYLSANNSNSEGSSATAYWFPTATGFSVKYGASYWFTPGNTVIYMAIRRGPMKVPTSGTSVLGISARTGTGANATVTNGSGVTDLTIIKNTSTAGVDNLITSRLIGAKYTSASNTMVEASAGATILQSNPWDVMNGIKVGTTSTLTNASGSTFINYLLSRAPTVFDAVCFNGPAYPTPSLNINHNLGVVPELIITITRSFATSHKTYSATVGATKYLQLSSNAAPITSNSAWNNTSPTSSVFTVGDFFQDYTVSAFLFATCAGVSKVGSYTGTGTTLQVNCGFASGARFVLIKRTDSTGDWYVWDSARGIVSGNDPYLLLNSSAAEVTTTDYIDTYSAGFEISSTAPAAINASGGTFIFLAIA